MARIRLHHVVEESQIETQRLKFRKEYKNFQNDKYQNARLQIDKQVKYATPILAKNMPLENHAAGLVGVEEATLCGFVTLSRKARKN
jgi:hypothetical protein